jgi:uncharacterized protein
MKIVWGEPKREWTLKNRGYDFMDLAAVADEFFAAAIIVGARDGRYKAVGTFRGRTVAVIFKPLGTEAISLISMRRASRKEREAHGKS